MGYPESVLTKGRKGRLEVRRLLSKGKFVKYDYTDPETGKPLEKGKFSIILKGEKEEHYYLIPLKGRFLAIPQKAKGKRKFWDTGEKRAVSLS